MTPPDAVPQAEPKPKKGPRIVDPSDSDPYIRTPRGILVPNLANAMTMMKELPIRFNSFTCRTYLEKQAPWSTQGDWTDFDDLKCAEWCQRHSLNVDHGTVANSAHAIGKARPLFHPVQSYLKFLKWNGEQKLDTWMIDHLGAEDRPLIRAISAKWMISAVGRVMQPGCQADYTLVLEGAQGRRKSTALRILAGGSENPEWFSDDIAEIGTKDSAMQLQGKWIIELAELDAVKRQAEITTVKAWLVRRDDNFRPPYGRRPQTFPRQNVFAASTNATGWGKDDSGLRRFWPVKVAAINIDALHKNRDQLWAEAFFRYCEGESSWLSAPLENLAMQDQNERQEVDAWTELVHDFMEQPNSLAAKSMPGKVFLSEILQYAIGLKPADWTPTAMQRASRILRLAGWCSKRVSRAEADDQGRRPEYWSPMSEK